MSIESDITALGPVLYWKLDDPTGPAASDASGHGHTGVYGGGFTLLQYGPEPGTFAAQFAAGGSVLCTNMAQISAAPWSACWYASRDVIATPASGDEIGGGNRTVKRGWFFNIANTEQGAISWYTGTGAVAATTLVTTPVWNKWWHAYAVVYNGSSSLTMWYDGTMVATATPTTTTWATSVDPFGVTAVYGVVVAHLAYFDKVLTGPQISAIHSHRWNWPFGPQLDKTWPSPPSGGGGGSLDPADPVVIDLNADLEQIRRSVQKQYLPPPP